MIRFYLFLLVWGQFCAGCASYTNSTPRQYLEGDDAGNYERILGAKPPENVTVVHSVVVTYAWRLFVVTTDDFEFELLVPKAWIEAQVKSHYLFSPGPGRSGDEFDRRKQHPIRDWYATKSIDHYVSYRDRTDVGYVHLLVEQTPEADGRWRVFISKH